MIPYNAKCCCPVQLKSTRSASCSLLLRLARITLEEERVLKCFEMNHMKRMERKANTRTRSTTYTARYPVSSRCLLQREPLSSTRKLGMPTPIVAPNEYMKDDFFIKIETWHKLDMGTTENPHGLSPEEWEEAEVVPIDIADRSQVDDVDYKPEEDPAIFHSEKTGRGPLGPGWKKELHNSNCPYMTAYKLVTVHFRWWGLQGRVENFIHKQEKRLFTNFHRQLFCWLDRWVNLTMDDIRRMEEETQRELDQMRNEGSVRGMKAGED
ncbi:phosphatidylinositol transfer protein, beta, like isoform X1 [Oncorhynchus keta]|uniref:phosphatidylinositol transfer protein, beta, like isoform X1 n=1 Tax=Oncorhynchus keta TaxID=8018 RepID=UPI00227C9902|nr:phosphatidylinositol transfer protein, beta, like isoform X1 [Oncorhynchus keta]